MVPFGRYTLVRSIAKGGMAEIWKAVALGPGGFEKVVALKKILPDLADDAEFVAMFTEEAKLVAGLVHPNIVQVFDFGCVEGDYFIAMEFVEGLHLGKLLGRLARHGEKLPLEVALTIAVDLCRGLGYAHGRTDSRRKPLNIVHRDVSPQNVLVSWDGDVKITDFGIAKAASVVARTAQGLARGKVPYMSPEQAAAEPLDHRSDLFSCGLLIFEMITGRRFFGGAAHEEIVERVVTHGVLEIADLPGVLPELAGVLVTALHPDPAGRFQNAGEMEEAFAAPLGLLGVTQARNFLASLLRRVFAEDIGREAAAAESEEVPALPSGALQVFGSEVAEVTEVTPGRPNTVTVKGRTGVRVALAQPDGLPAPATGGRSRLLVPAGAAAGLVLAAVAAVGLGVIPLDRSASPTPAAPSPTPAVEQTALAVETLPLLATPPAASPSIAPASGILNVSARPWSEVWVDGKRVAKDTPLHSYRIAKGRHVLRFVNPATGFNKERTLDVSAGAVVRIHVDTVAGTIEVQ